jgi:hypothetical protein
MLKQQSFVSPGFELYKRALQHCIASDLSALEFFLGLFFELASPSVAQANT